MKISTRGRYALRAMMEMAELSGKETMTLNEIAKNQDLPLKYLANLLVKLQEKDLVISFKGKYGGYRLGKSAEIITVADILEAVEGPLGLIACINKPEVCEKVDDCKARDAWIKINLDIREVFQKYTLRELTL